MISKAVVFLFIVFLIFFAILILLLLFLLFFCTKIEECSCCHLLLEDIAVAFL